MALLTHRATITAIAADIRQRLGHRKYTMLLAGCTMSLAGDLLRVVAANRFVRDWIQRGILGAIEDAAKHAELRGVRIVVAEGAEASLFENVESSPGVRSELPESVPIVALTTRPVSTDTGRGF